VARAETFDLTPTNRQMINISTVNLHFDGQLNGTAYLVPYAAGTQELSGTVNLGWSGDITADNYLLRYIPGTATTGALSVTYILR